MEGDVWSQSHPPLVFYWIFVLHFFSVLCSPSVTWRYCYFVWLLFSGNNASFIFFKCHFSFVTLQSHLSLSVSLKRLEYFWEVVVLSGQSPVNLMYYLLGQIVQLVLVVFPKAVYSFTLNHLESRFIVSLVTSPQDYLLGTFLKNL